MVAFYNAADQELYKKYKFLPQEQYRLGLNLPTDPVTDPVANQGIVNTNAFVNSGGGDGFSVYNPDPNSIVNKEYDPYPYRNAAENSFLPGGSNSTDPKYLNQSYDPSGKIANAQTMYNKASADLKDPFNRLAQTETFTGMRPSKQVMDYYNEQIMDNRQNYGAQGQYETVDSPLAYSGQTELEKMKESYPGYFEKEDEELTGIKGLISRGINLIPGVGGLKIAGQALGGFMPTNRRSIMENELAGQGIRVNDIGQIVGDRDTLEGVLAGKNASQVTGKTFDKQIATLEKTLGGKYGLTAKDIADIKSGKKSATDFNLTTDLIGRLRNNIIGKGQFLDILKKTDTVFGDKKNKDEDETTITNPNITSDIVDEVAITGGNNNEGSGGTPPGFGTTPEGNYTNQFDGGDPGQGQGNNEGNQNDNSPGSQGPGGSDEMGSFARGGRAGYFFGGRVGYAEGGPIYSRLGTLSSGVQSAEQQLQGINASLQKAESDLGSDSPGGGSSLAGGPSFTSNFEDANNQGPGSNLLFGGSSDGTINNTAVPKIDGMYKDSDGPLGSLYGGGSGGTIKNTMAPREPGQPEAGPVSSIGGNSSPPSTGGQDPVMAGFQKSEFRKNANMMQQDAVNFKYDGKDMMMNGSMAGAFQQYLDSIGKGDLMQRNDFGNAGLLQIGSNESYAQRPRPTLRPGLPGSAPLQAAADSGGGLGGLLGGGGSSNSNFIILNGKKMYNTPGAKQPPPSNFTPEQLNFMQMTLRSPGDMDSRKENPTGPLQSLGQGIGSIL
jgi:hypothetical protein